jgi:hypothetical protein
MKSLRSTLTLLLSVAIVLLMAQTAAAAPGKGGVGKDAAVKINVIRLIDSPPQGGEILAEISGGGFLAGDFLKVTLDGNPLVVEAGASEDMLVATISGVTSADDDDHLIVVTTGGDNKQSDSATIRLGGTMSVSCISWFVSGPADEHVHTEVHVEDENGEAVIGASVTWTAGNDTVGEYQENTSLTNDIDGHAGELLTCPDGVSGSGVTDWFCCIGAGKWDGETPPGRRACAPGEYTATIVNVAAPLFTNMFWDEVVVVTTFTLENTKFP